jgi:ribulose 1,5-bisphosphate synthetase/thiazole synthase
MTGRIRMDSDAFYKAIEHRPSGMIIPEAVTTFSKSYQCSVDSNCCESIRKCITRFHKHINRIRNELHVEAEMVVVKSKTVEPVITPEVVISTSSMKVGDIVIANWNITDTPGLNGQVVKILVFEGDQACVKDPSGTISVFNVKNLRPIPKDF